MAMTGTGAPIFTFEDFLARASTRLSLKPPPPEVTLWGDHAIDECGDPPGAEPFRPAAVLLPVVAHEREATVLLTRRADGLRQHSGQIALPGGKVDATDPSPLAAALREAEEEIGLPRERVVPLGYLDSYATRTGFNIFPIVATVKPPFEPKLNPDEVGEAFEVPLGFLMEAANHQRQQTFWRGRVRHYYAMPYADRHIWGVTAGILRNLYEKLYR